MNLSPRNLIARVKQTLSAAYGYSNTSTSQFWGTVQESFAGAWQRNVVVESQQNLLAFSAVYACIALIADDISKLRIKLCEKQRNGIWTEVDRNAPHAPVLRKPNQYQTRVQFLSYWMVSKLLFGNTYVLKERDKRGIVVALYVLDPRMVTPLVGNDGAVFYKIKRDYLSGLSEDVIVEASEIIHDRCNAFFHPLIGVSPIYACGTSATQGIRIQSNSERFFQNMSRPSGHLSAPGTIPDDRLKEMKADTEKAFSGGNLGRMLITGDGMKFTPMTIPANDAQLIEQLRWTREDVASAFKVPLYKIGGPMPTFNNAGMANQDYYTQTLQTYIEAIEILLDEGLDLNKVTDHEYGTELDLDGLLRMDSLSRMEVAAKGVGAGVIAPNEARLKENLPPVPGGDACYLQQQNYSLEALNKRDTTVGAVPPSATPAASAQPAPDASGADAANDPNAAAEQAAKALAGELIAKFMAEPAHAL